MHTDALFRGLIGESGLVDEECEWHFNTNGDRQYMFKAKFKLKEVT